MLAFRSCPAGLERSKKSKGKGEISRGLWYVSLSLCEVCVIFGSLFWYNLLKTRFVRAFSFSFEPSLFFLSSLVRDQLIRVVVMDGNLHSKAFCSRALISMLIVSWANNRASLFLSYIPPISLSLSHTHTLCTSSYPLPQRSGTVLLTLMIGRRGSGWCFVVLSQTVWLRAG